MSDALDLLQEALTAALAAPAAVPNAAEEDDAADIATPRAKAATALETVLRARMVTHWERGERQGEQLCRVLGDMCVWHEHGTLRQKVLDLQRRGIALLAAVPDGEPSAGDVGEIEDDYQAIKPREDDAAAIAAALGMTLEEARNFGLVGTLTGVGFDDEAPAPVLDASGTMAAPAQAEEEDLETLFRRDTRNRAAKDLPAALLAFRGNPQSMDLMRSVRRGFHTMKGDARIAAASTPQAAKELEGLAVLSEAAEDIIDYLVGEDFDPAQPAPPLPPGAFALMSDTATAIVARLDAGRPLDNEVGLLRRLAAMQRKAAAQTGVIIDEASLAAKIPLPSVRLAVPKPVAAPRAAATGHTLLPTFLEEASHLMPDLHRSLGVLSINAADESALLLARRKLHTLKGGAALIGAEAAEVQAIAHHAEDLFELIEDFQLRGELYEVPRDVLDGVLDAEDALQILLDNLAHVNSGGLSPVQPLMQPVAELVSRLQEITDRVRGGDQAIPDVLAMDGPGDFIPLHHEPASELPTAAPAPEPPPIPAPALPAAPEPRPVAPDSGLLQRVVVPPATRRPLTIAASLHDVSFNRMIEESEHRKPRSRTAMMDSLTAVEERARLTTTSFSLFIGVQAISHFLADAARYQELVGEKGQIYVFGAIDREVEPQRRVTIVPLIEGDALLSERFAIFESPLHCTAFFAHDDAATADSSGRRFTCLLLEDPVVIREVAGQLRAAVRREGSAATLTRRAVLRDTTALAPLPRLKPVARRRQAPLPVETPARQEPDFGKEASVRTALTALEDLSVTRDALQVLVGRMSQQRVESRRSGLRLRTLAERVGSELAGLRSELVRTTRRSGEWDLLEKEEFTTVDVLLQQLDEALADLEESDNSLRRDLGEATAQVDIQSDKALLAQRALLDISMIPLSQIQDRLGHAVRSASRRLHKQVSFTLQGGDLVLDSRIADSLFEPLMHLINNAIDHGIEESAVARLAAGKPAEGHVTIRGRAAGDGVAIEVIDDGRGIDSAAIGAAALARGTVTAAELATMTDEQLVALIWRPGFSTAASVTAISGRGIGMKSAYDDIAALHGHIEIHSVAGQGTTLAITLPRTLAMLRVEVVREGKNLVAIPITQLVATHSVPYAELARIRPGQSVQVGNSNLAVFGITLAEGIAGDGEAGHATLLEVADKDGAIAVDEVRGSQYLPVRAAPPYLRRHVGLIGYAIGGGGQILPILDLPTLIERSIAQMTEAPRPAARMTYNILVVDDSQTMRRALRDTLSKAGFTVQEAVDGHDALDICIRQMPDLITLDMEMPGMDGLEALTALRLLPNGGSTVPVFMITSRQQARHRAAALAAGVTRYFTKPFDTDELLSATNLVLTDGSSQASEAAS